MNGPPHPDAALDWERLATNLRVENALLRALEVLDGLPLVVFKGAVLTRMIYGDLRRRASADNDIWVRGGRAEEALARLERLDFRAAQGLDPRAALRRLGQVALWRRGEQGEVSLDLHAAPFSGRYFRVNEQDLLPHLCTVELHGRTVTTFDRYLALTHMVAHWVQHHLEPSHLPFIRDAWDAWSPDLAPKTIVALARKTCSEEGLRAALLLAHPQASLPFPPTPSASLRVRFVVAGIEKGGLKVYSPLDKLLSLLLVAPQRLPEGVLRATFLESDDLISRYGSANRAFLLGRHLWHTLSK